MPLAATSNQIGLENSLYMSDIMFGLLLLAIGLLVGSLFIVRNLTKELPQGTSRSRWYILGGLIVLFFFGYLAFIVLKYGESYIFSEILVAVIFFFGAVFVLMVCLLAYRTTLDLKRVYALEQETITDPLLGIFNRRCLDRRLLEEVLRAHRHRLDLSLLMVDIDNFKQVNDTWGHQVGDMVLHHLTQLLADALRQTDILARYGGEEFVILLPHTSEEESFNLAERLRVAVEQTPLHRIPELKVTVSIGVACLLLNDDNAYSLLERADKAMYWAKREGRNKVVRYTELANAEKGWDSTKHASRH
ncbi:MAG: GGDEF domain-containing protein [Desulfuromonadaceae bacterium]